MPKLQQLRCSINTGPSQLKEYGHRYGDGVVETFIAVPNSNLPFSIHLESDGYIAPGLSAWVYIDGQYQVNRNKIGLKAPGDGVRPEETNIDFHFRQKEEKTNREAFVTREWTFTGLNTKTADARSNTSRRFLGEVGTIEILVLRCKDGGASAPPQQVTARAPKEKSRVPSVAASRANTRVSDSGLDALFGLLDGTNDDHYATREVPARVNEAHWDNASQSYSFRGGRAHASSTPIVGDGTWSDTSSADARVERIRYGDLANARDPDYKMNSTREARAWMEKARKELDDIESSKGPFFLQMTESTNDPARQRELQQNLDRIHSSGQLARAVLSQAAQMLEDYQQEGIGAGRAAQHSANISDANYDAQRAQTPAQMNPIGRFDGGHYPSQQPNMPDYPESVAKTEPNGFAKYEMLMAQNPQGAAAFLDGQPYVQNVAQQPFNHSPQMGFQGMQMVGKGTYRPGQQSTGWNRSGQGNNTQSDPWSQNKGHSQNGGANGWADDKSNSKPRDGNQQGGWGGSANNGWASHHSQPQPAYSKFSNSQKSNKSNNDWKAASVHDSHRNDWRDPPPQDGRDNKSDKNSQHGRDEGGWGEPEKKSQHGTDRGWGEPEKKSQHGTDRGWGEPDKKSQHGGSDVWAAKSEKKSQHGGYGGERNAPEKDQSQAKLASGWSFESETSSMRAKSYRDAGRSISSRSDIPKGIEGPRLDRNTPAMALPSVPKDGFKSATRGVQAGPGATYTHNTHRPEYLDDINKPYAVFSFRYRSKAAVESIIGRSIDADVKQLADQIKMDRLKNLPKHKLVEELMRARAPEGGSRSGGSSKSHGGSNGGRSVRDGGSSKTTEHNFAGNPW